MARCSKTRPLTDEGKKLKKMLIEHNMTQAEFCQKHDIPPNRLSEIMHTDTTEVKRTKWRLKIYVLMKRYKKSV